MASWTRAAAVCALVVLAACAQDDAETDEMMADSAAMAAPAAPPAELLAAQQQEITLWNGEDAAALAAMFTQDAVVVDDTMTYTGRDAIQNQWMAPNLPVITTLQTQDVTNEPEGADFRSRGRYTLALALPDGEQQVTGTYESIWTRDTDGQWRIRSSTVTADPPPASSTGQ